MNNYRVAVRLINENKIRNLMFIIAEFLVAGLMYLLFNLMNNTAYDELGLSVITLEAVDSLTMQTGNFETGNYFVIMSLMAALYAVIMNFYISQVFYATEDKSFINFSLSGFSPDRIMQISVLQYLILGVPAIIAGVLCSRFIFIPAFDSYVYSRLGITGPIGHIFKSTRFMLYSMLISVFIMSVMFQYSKMSIRTVYEVLENEGSFLIKIKRKESTATMAIVSAVVYVFGLVYSVIGKSAYKTDYTCMLGIISCLGLVAYTIPYVLKKWINVRPGYRKTVICCHIIEDLNESIISCLLLLFCSIVTVGVLSSSEVSYVSYVATCFALASIVTMISILLFAKFFTKLEKRKRMLNSINLLGYRLKDDLFVCLMEIVFFYPILIVVPGLFDVGIIKVAVSRGYMTLANGYLMIVLYMVPLLISLLITLLFYMTRIRKEFAHGNTEG